MIVSKIAVTHLQIPLRIQFAQANQNTSKTDSVVVRLQTQRGSVGYGEACPRTYVTGEHSQELILRIRKDETQLLGRSFNSWEDIREWSFQSLAEGHGHALICALELALLDAWCREYRQDLCEVLGVQRPFSAIDYSGVLPFGKWEKLRPVVSAFQFKSWKFKASADSNQNRQRIVDMQTLLGKDTPLRMDANGGWEFEQAREHITTALALGVNSFEQPLDKSDENGSQKLVAAFGKDAHIMADESLCSWADAQQLIASKACNHFSLKLSKNGGLFNTLRIYQLAQNNGIPCQLSAHYGETSILSAAGALLASLAPNLTACEGALGTYLLSEDITSTPFMVNKAGQVQATDLSFMGWPVQVEEARVKKYGAGDKVLR